MKHRIAVLAVAVITLTTAWPITTVRAQAEVMVKVGSYRTTFDGHLFRVFGEIENTSAYRINGYVTVGVSPGRTGAHETLYDTVMIANLAPGGRSPFVVTNNYVITPASTPVVESISAGGYVSETAVVGAVGVSATGSIQNGGLPPYAAISVQVRNKTSTSIHVSDVVATFYDADGNIAAVAKNELDYNLGAGLSIISAAQGLSLSTATRVALSVNAFPVGGTPGSLVAWTNWFYDTGSSPFLPEIAWLAETGITTGCTATQYCPRSPVSRGQMATFLDRALPLPTTVNDYFTDDETSVHEAAINRLRAAAITYGCTATTFCPLGNVTREQMAAFLTRALDLPATATDYFTDDETSTLEDEINSLRASGITFGCTATKFCPKASVTREQMAAFLYRALH